MSDQSSVEYIGYISDTSRSERNAHARNFDDYSSVFGYNEKNLKGKFILDVGSGDSDFAQKASSLGAKVARLDPKYRPRPTQEELTEKPYLNDPYLGLPSNTEKAAAGIVQELPFKDGSFDETVANTSMYWVEKGISQSLAEMLRVTKPGGFVKIYPAFFTSNDTNMGKSDFPLGAKLVDYSGVRGKTLVIPKGEATDSNQQKEEINKLTGMVKFTNMLPSLPA